MLESLNRPDPFNSLAPSEGWSKWEWKGGDGPEAGRVQTQSNTPTQSSPSEEEAKRWRKQALDWLRAELAHWTKQARSGLPEAKVKRVLDHWKVDTDLSTIRDERWLKSLPEQERDACRSLWANVRRAAGDGWTLSRLT